MKAVLAAFVALGSRPALGRLGPESPVALVQSAVRVHVASDLESANWGEFLVFNSELQHTGPGVLFRLSKSLSDLAGRDKYAQWGSVLNGTNSSDGWIQHKNYYLPTHINGKQIIKMLESQEQPHTAANSTTNTSAKPQLRKRLPFRYSPTEVKVQDGSWVPCQVLGEGSKPNSFDIEVQPRSFAPYRMADVPAEALKKIQRVKVLPKTSKDTKGSKATNLQRSVNDQASISLKVDNTKGQSFKLKMFKKSPMRTIMKMSCEKAKISWYKCQKLVQFTVNGQPVLQTDSVDALGLRDGDTVLMAKW